MEINKSLLFHARTSGLIRTEKLIVNVTEMEREIEEKTKQIEKSVPIQLSQQMFVA